MAQLPTVAIIGRPNTGKSTLFNSLLKRRVAIVSDVPGTTRDHIASRIETDDVDYLLLDTGGMGGGTEDKDFEKDVHEQSLLAVHHADLILFTVNAREELTASDRAIAQILRKGRKRHVPVIIVATKCDNPDIAEEAERALHELGIGSAIIPVSALNNVGTADIRQAVGRELVKLQFHKQERPAAEAGIPRIALVGKPNVGKSSLINALMSDVQRKESPRLVSPVPGTTRDVTDTVIRRDDKEFLFVDTAGLARHAHRDRGIEGYAFLRTIRAIEDADVAVIVLDATQPISKQDKHIVGLAVDGGKGIILVLNKTDLITTEERELKLEELKDTFLFCRYAPVLSVSALTRQNLPKLFNLVTMVYANRTRRLPEKELHTWLRDQIFGKPMSSLSSAKHITQAKDPPPTFILFVKNPKHVQLSQLRFLDNRLRETFGLEGTPVRWITKGPRDRE
ncbi:MAG: ribosome biogenesis GTPase Der [Candidatus Peribacteraceae bacterium]|nr:ribosome biogenesis GTPase Der [Candidatus Peribacteraceae bacterium]